MSAHDYNLTTVMQLALSYQLRKRGTNEFNDLLQVKKNVCKEAPTKDASCPVQVQRPSYSSICYPELGLLQK